MYPLICLFDRSIHVLHRHDPGLTNTQHLRPGQPVVLELLYRVGKRPVVLVRQHIQTFECQTVRAIAWPTLLRQPEQSSHEHWPALRLHELNRDILPHP